MKDYNDYELVYLAKENNEDAREILFQKYKPIIMSKAKKKLPIAKKLGIEMSDLVQEAMLGFSEAIRDFEENERVLFYTFALMCIERQLINCIRNADANKNRTLNEAISLDSIDEERTEPLFNYYGDFEANPENKLIRSLEEEELIEKVENELTEFECQVFELKLKGFTYLEIAEILDKESKAIDNAVQRIKNKIKLIINKKEN